ncbi:MAG: SDR family oxidoreductase [Rhizobiales bacterium]|nr:SDR family oxidoreductase [Hyphomicrobiales bacterium]
MSSARSRCITSCRRGWSRASGAASSTSPRTPRASALRATLGRRWGDAAGEAAGEARLVRLDVTDRASVEAPAQRIEAELGSLDALVHAAGWDIIQPFMDRERLGPRRQRVAGRRSRRLVRRGGLRRRQGRRHRFRQVAGARKDAQEYPRRPRGPRPERRVAVRLAIRHDARGACERHCDEARRPRIAGRLRSATKSARPILRAPSGRRAGASP